MDFIYRLRDTYINLADIKTFSLAVTNSNERELKSIFIKLREEGHIKIDFKDRTEAERYCKELKMEWGKYLLTLPPPVLHFDEEQLEEMFERRRPLNRFYEIFC